MATPVVLDEDTYTEAISLIIERDFFPKLAKMRAQQSYLEAQNHGSLSELQEAGRALHNVSVQQKKGKQRSIILQRRTVHWLLSTSSIQRVESAHQLLHWGRAQHRKASEPQPISRPIPDTIYQVRWEWNACVCGYSIVLTSNCCVARTMHRLQICWRRPTSK